MNVIFFFMNMIRHTRARDIISSEPRRNVHATAHIV